jgi:hypothetical protein
MINFLRNLFSTKPAAPKYLMGKLEKIDLTFGGAGNQVMTIDGVQYATWIDYSKWPKIGEEVTFYVYHSQDGRGRLLKAANIVQPTTI